MFFSGKKHKKPKGLTKRIRKYAKRNHKSINKKTINRREVINVPTHNIKPINCSPAVKGKTVSETSCLTPKILLDIKNKYNEDHPNEMILSKDPRIIWRELHNRLSKEGCKKEGCWLKELDNPTLQKEIKTHIFAPDMPAEWKTNPDEWLSNYDIFNVITQYEETYPEFKFLGPTTIDFDTRLPEKNNKCVEEEVCKLNLKTEIHKGYRKFACVINLDKHWQSGSHWVSIFIDIDENAIIYFDSAGSPNIPNEVNEFTKRMTEQGKTLVPPKNLKFYTNGKLHHQTGNTECGMYSIFFVITMLTGKTPFYKNRIMSFKERLHLFLNKRIPDNVVFDYRDLYFNSSTE